MAKRPDTLPIRNGKNALMERLIADHVLKHPDAVIVRCGPDGIRVEKRVKELGPLALPSPKPDPETEMADQTPAPRPDEDQWPQATAIAAQFIELTAERRAELATLIDRALEHLYWKTVADYTDIS